MARDSRDPGTLDMFAAADMYPVRAPRAPSGMSFDVRLKRALSVALKECDSSREVVAAEMAEYLDEPNFSRAMLDAYTAESRETHQIPTHRLIALIKVTGAVWLLDVLAAELGAVVMVGEEVRLAQLGYLEQQKAEIDRKLKRLKKLPAAKVRDRRP